MVQLMSSKHNVKISTTDPAGPEGITWPVGDEATDVDVNGGDWQMAGVMVMGRAIIDGVAGGFLEPGDEIWAVVSDGAKEHIVPGFVPPESDLAGLRETYDEAERAAFDALAEGKPIITWPRRDRGTGR
jgi:hypothetical protein